MAANDRLPETLKAELDRLAASRRLRPVDAVLAENHDPQVIPFPGPAPAPRPKVAPVEGILGQNPWWNRD